MNPFDWRGPDFLLFYVLLLPIGLAAAYLLRRASLGPRDMPLAGAPKLDPYEVAYLAGGLSRVMTAAVGTLAQRGSLEIAGEKLFATQDSRQQSDHPVEKSVLDYTQEPVSAAILRGAIEPACVSLRKRLDTEGLLLDDSAAASARWQPLLLALTVPALGAVKILVGVDRDRPVGFLVLLCVGSVAVSLLMFGRRPFRSGRGEQVLAELKRAHQALRVTSAAQPASIALTDLGLAIALFSLTAVQTPQLNAVRQVFDPKDVGNAPAWGSGRGSYGCGGACGGGGGGGCGGGGCGGCSS